VCSSETSVNFCHITGIALHIPIIHSYRCENLKPFPLSFRLVALLRPTLFGTHQGASTIVRKAFDWKRSRIKKKKNMKCSLMMRTSKPRTNEQKLLPSDRRLVLLQLRRQLSSHCQFRMFPWTFPSTCWHR
jgi:transposase